MKEPVLARYLQRMISVVNVPQTILQSTNIRLLQRLTAEQFVVNSPIFVPGYADLTNVRIDVKQVLSVSTFFSFIGSELLSLG